MIRDDATEAQVRAASPFASTWLTANAGSGKTRVLTDRVARLLLQPDTAPQRILCLTYTKAAASEMQNRLFRRLGDWAMQDDDALRQNLRDLGEDGTLSAPELRRARTLFARAIETPGGLKVQTIHSFCAAILRRFPLEAKVSPGFQEMEDRAAALLRAEIIEEMAEGPDSAAMARLAAVLGGTDFDTITAEITRNRPAFDPPLNRAEICRLLQIDPGMTTETLLARVFLGDECDLFRRIAPALLAGLPTDGKTAAKLRGIEGPSLAALKVLEGVFLTGAGAKSPFSAKIGTLPTKDTRELLGDDLQPLEDLMRRVEEARDLRIALEAADRSAALHDFAARFLPRYGARKLAMGWLDFDDLIYKTRDLLRDPAVASWVLYRLDGGIDHILVDEAQDTSPAQWEVIELLSQEITAGEGARSEVRRTIFVVGDKKQSIYSFQGADPREFDRMQQRFRDKLANTNAPLQSAGLEFSFRSAETILGLVDQTFAGRADSGFPADNRHRAFKAAMPGRVDLWPVIPAATKTDKANWFDPVDILAPDHHARQLARQIAGQISAMITDQTLIPADRDGVQGMRPVTAGDFLILVQRRSDIFAEIIRACKEAGLPIAGADRLKVGAELAVRDLAALMSFLAVPEDDLSLAVALKSPLFGWSEQALFDLAHRRTGPLLWPALRDRAAEFADTLAVLNDLRDSADFLRPYDLLERILTRHDGRRHLLARLGPEAEDGINAFLAQALAYERNAIPSLTGFLHWMQTDELEIKRQVDQASDQIRVMTVHGAKGLEAPIVILPDCARYTPPDRGTIMVHDGHALWRMSSNEQPPALAPTRQASRDAQRAERDRLLYVAMTRAEKWLIVAAAGDLDKEGNCWYATVAEAHQHFNPVDVATPFGTVRRVETGNWDADRLPETPPPPSATLAPDALFARPAPPPPPRQTILAPSGLGGAKALPGAEGLDEESALRRGRLLHLLLEHLPGVAEEARAAQAATLLAGSPDPVSPAEAQTLLAEAQAVLHNPELAFLFTDDTLREVDLTAELAPGLRLHGRLDLLHIAPDRVLAVDFKTNATVPDDSAAVPDGVLRQMAAYDHALRRIYPDRPVECAILWTAPARLMALPGGLLSDARARYLEARATASE